MITKKHTFRESTDRYEFDFVRCTKGQGFSQIDTSQDAPYFGTWANPFKRVIVQYIEGDIYKVMCDTDKEFILEMKKLLEYNRKHGFTTGIDPLCSKDAEERWRELKFQTY